MKASLWHFSSCPLPFPSTTWRARLVDAADGDTVVLEVDRGWFSLDLMEIRFSDIDTWERRSGTESERLLGRAAWEYVVAHCVGRWCYLHTEMDTEKYGRILGTIEYLAVDGSRRYLSGELRERGFEKAVTP